MKRSAAKSNRILKVISNGSVVGTLVQESRTAQLRFAYEDAWRAADGAYPVSLSMPLVQAEYPDEVVRNVLSGILPDRRATLDEIARDHHVATDDPFALLGVLGEDCPGAMQYVRPERLDAMLDTDGGTVAWLTERDVASRIIALGTPGAPGRLHGDAGYFSLAGQQPKSALYYDERANRWGVPEGGIPTTHIVKPTLGPDLRYLAAEYLSLTLAVQLQMSAASTFILRAEDQIALAIKRYDRAPDGSRWLRAHQEDLCQALCISPALKYEKGGGPGIREIMRLIETVSVAPAVDAWRFLEAIVLNWVLIGTDAHARNYSLLIGTGGSARLAPLYDVASVLDIAEKARLHIVNLAMQIGGSYTATKIRRAGWEQLAIDLQRKPVELRERVATLVKRIPIAMETVAEEARSEAELPSGIVTSLEEKIKARAARCLRIV